MREGLLWLWVFCHAKGLPSAMGILPRERITFGEHSSRGSAVFCHTKGLPSVNGVRVAALGKGLTSVKEVSVASLGPCAEFCSSAIINHNLISQK